MAKRRVTGLLLAFFSLTVGVLAAEEPRFNWNLDDIKVNWFAVPTGPIFKFGFGPLALMPGLHSAFEGKFGAGYENIAVSRSDRSGDPLPLGAPGMSAIDKPDAQWELGFRQGLVPLDEKRDLISVWSSLHGRFEMNPWAGIVSIYPDRNTAFIHSLLAGATLDDSRRSVHGQLSGTVLGLEGEWGPSFLSLEGTDFWRLKAEATEYLPLFDLPTERNMLSGSLVLRANAKYIEGRQVPIFMLEGTDVRAYPQKLDTKIRAYAAVEPRLNLPSIIGKSDLLPTLFVFCDSGYYRGYNDLPANSAWVDSASGRESSGFLLSAGGGLELDAFQLAQLVVSAGIPILDADSLGIPNSNQNAFWWSVDLSMHIK